MFPYSKSITPAVRAHLDAQTSFMNDVSKSIFHSLQQLNNLNLQLAQTLLEESAITTQQLLTADQHTDMVGACASRVQPAADKVRAYHQHLSRLAADTQVELSRVTEEHVQETAQTSKTLAEEVARAAVEDTERNIQKQEESIRHFSDPFTDVSAKTNVKRGGANVMRGSASVQSSSPGSMQSSSPGSSQSGGSQSSGKHE